MTNKENLQSLLQRSVQLYGEDALVTLNLKRQLREIEEERLSGQDPQRLQFQTGFRARRREA
jgi:hypothetical protein